MSQANSLRKFRWFPLHVVLWSLMFYGPVSKGFSLHHMSPELASYSYILFGFCMMVFYLHYLVLIPKLLFESRTKAYFASAVGLVIIIFLISFAVASVWSPHDGMQTLLNRPIPEGAQGMRYIPILSAVVTTLVALALRLVVRSINQEKLLQLRKKEKYKMELTFLKNQISPHFFFNTLNNIYALTGSDPEKAQDIILQLSKLMRYLLYESEKEDLGFLGRETQFMNHYVELMRVRLPEGVEVTFEHGSESDNTRIPPLLFIPFVENAFKHGMSFQEPSRINLTLQRTKDHVEFSAINTIPANKTTENGEGGVGLANVKRRLELFYNRGSYDLQIRNNGTTFSVELKLPVHVDSMRRSG